MPFGSYLANALGLRKAPSPTDEIYKRYGVNPGGRERGSELSAAITRSQYENYRSRFQPLEDQLIEMYQNGPTEEDYQQGVESSFARQDLTNEVNQRRYGLQARPDQQAAMDKRSEFAKGAAAIDAKNRFQTDSQERSFEALGGMPGRS